MVFGPNAVKGGKFLPKELPLCLGSPYAVYVVEAVVPPWPVQFV